MAKFSLGLGINSQMIIGAIIGLAAGYLLWNSGPPAVITDSTADLARAYETNADRLQRYINYYQGIRGYGGSL